MIAGLLLAVARVESAMGRILIRKSGDILLWSGNTYGPGNSRHLTDWHAFSHIIHGMIFYGLLRLLARGLPVRTRLLPAVPVERVWEIAENSPFVIDRYRAVTAALDYTGDSIVNSLFDVAAAMLGFWPAHRLRARWIIAPIVFLELLTLSTVRDNLTLNAVMLVHPVQSVKAWQLDSDFAPPAPRKP